MLSNSLTINEDIFKERGKYSLRRVHLTEDEISSERRKIVRIGKERIFIEAKVFD